MLADLAGAAGAAAGPGSASTLTKKRKLPGCCTPSVNSTFTDCPAAMGAAGVMVTMPELSPPPFG